MTDEVKISLLWVAHFVVFFEVYIIVSVLLINELFPLDLLVLLPILFLISELYLLFIPILSMMILRKFLKFSFLKSYLGSVLILVISLLLRQMISFSVLFSLLFIFYILLFIFITIKPYASNHHQHR